MVERFGAMDNTFCIFSVLNEVPNHWKSSLSFVGMMGGWMDGGIKG